MIRRLRPEPHILDGGVGLRDDVHGVPELPHTLHDLAGQMRLARPGIARQQQALAAQAVCEEDPPLAATPASL